MSNSCLAEVNEPEIFKSPIVVKEVSASVIVLSSLERLLQDEVVVRGAEEAEIFCAKNEYESFQIIIVNPTDTPISQINLNADNWHFTGTPGEGSPELTDEMKTFVSKQFLGRWSNYQSWFEKMRKS